MNDELPKQPALTALHAESSLNAGKLTTLDKLSTDVLRESLAPGREQCLKTRPDGRMLDGHHRIHILRSRGVDVDALPREVLRSAD